MTYTTQIRNTHYTFTGSDFTFLLGAVLFGVLATHQALTTPTLITYGLSTIQAVLAVGLVAITLHRARRTYLWNTYGNWVGKFEAIQNHALFEGY